MKMQTFLSKNNVMLDVVNTYNETATREQFAFTSLLLVEEMSELTQEIVKIFVRERTDRGEQFHEELADVILLLDQVVRMADPEKLDSALKNKMKRFIDRYGHRPEVDG